MYCILYYICNREEFSTFKIESEFIDKFDTYISGSSMGDTDYVLIFNTLLKDLFQKDEVLSSIGTALIKQLTDLLGEGVFTYSKPTDT